MSALHDAVREMIYRVCQEHSADSMLAHDVMETIYPKLAPLLEAAEEMHTELSTDHTVPRCESMDRWDAAVDAITEGNK